MQLWAGNWLQTHPTACRNVVTRAQAILSITKATCDSDLHVSPNSPAEVGEWSHGAHLARQDITTPARPALLCSIARSTA